MTLKNPKNKPYILSGLQRTATRANRLQNKVRKAAGKESRKFHKYGRMLGPGLIAGAADDDAGGIATYSIVGATTGYALSWLLLLTTPMLIVVQGICARLGNITHKGLATLIREKYGKKIAMLAALVLVIANVTTIAADVAGMSVAVELVTGLQWYYAAIPLVMLILYVVVFKNFKTIEKLLVYFSFVLVAYIISGFLANPAWINVISSTLVPHIEFNSAFLIAAVGLLGTTITPYLFFWQTSTEIEAKRNEKQLKRVDVDIFTGMIYSNLISYFIILSSGTILFPLASKMGGLGQAHDPVRFIALALKPVAGEYTFYLFALGLFAASVLAIAVLSSSTAYVVSETLGWNKGLNKRVWQAKKFYAVLCLSVLAGMGILFAGVQPIDAMYYSQVLAGVLSPLLLVMIVRIATDESIMGAYAVKGWWKGIAWFTIAVMGLFVLLMFKSLLGL